MTKIATVKTIRRRIAAKLDANPDLVYFAQVDAMNVREARDGAARFGARSFLIQARGPAGWSVIEVCSCRRDVVRRVLDIFGYGREVSIETR